MLLDALNYLILISEVEETEIFKICLDYWNTLASELYRETPATAQAAGSTGGGQASMLLIGGLMGGLRQMEMSPRRALYKDVLNMVSLNRRFATRSLKLSCR